MMGKKLKVWDRISRLIEEIPLKPIVCLGKGEEAAWLVKKWSDRVLVVDRDFSSFHIDSHGIAHEVWGSIYAPWQTHSRLIADFRKIEFKKESIGAVLIPELFLIEKGTGLKLLERAATWIVKNGIVVVRVQTTLDIRYKNFKSFGATFKKVMGQYKFQEITPGGLKVDPPIPCLQGCPHEYFSFYHPSEIRQRFPSFKVHLNIVQKDKEGFAPFFYVAQKL